MHCISLTRRLGELKFSQYRWFAAQTWAKFWICVNSSFPISRDEKLVFLEFLIFSSATVGLLTLKFGECVVRRTSVICYFFHIFSRHIFSRRTRRRFCAYYFVKNETLREVRLSERTYRAAQPPALRPQVDRRAAACTIYIFPYNQMLDCLFDCFIDWVYVTHCISQDRRRWELKFSQ